VHAARSFEIPRPYPIPDQIGGRLSRKDTESRILAFIRSHRAKYQTGPSLREIQQHMGWRSSNAPRHWLEKLYKAGKVTWSAGRAGTIRTIDGGKE